MFEFWILNLFSCKMKAEWIFRMIVPTLHHVSFMYKSFAITKVIPFPLTIKFHALNTILHGLG